MDTSTESNERHSASMNHNGPASEKQASDSQDYSYEDDFEDVSDSYSKDKAQDSSSTVTPTTTTASTEDPKKGHAGDSENTSSTTTTTTTESKSEKQQETQDKQAAPKPSRPSYDEHSDDSEPEPEGDSYVFTDDQQRAMMELMAQKHDSGDYSDDPPEYNVKERLKELNAELAKEPDPEENDRSHRVGFKAELVDLVAPPPEVSDEEDSARKMPMEDSQKSKSTAGAQDAGGDGKKTFVVERDGKFDVVGAQDLTASERALFNIPNGETDQGRSVGSSGDSGDNRANLNNSNSQRNKENIQPSPPSKPRPATANGHSRRTVRPSSSPRPHTAQSSHSSGLEDFDYKSPYAMTAEEKERAAEQAKTREEQRKEEERRRKQEEEYQRQESEDAFQAWLQKKREEDRRKKQEEDERKKREDKEDRSKENEEAFKGWLKAKHTQTQREKLLKKRQEQEMKDGYYVHSREDCDKAYKEWLKNKYTEIRRQRAAEKQRVKAFRSQARRTRKQQMMARALRQSQAFRYVDYYGYRF